METRPPDAGVSRRREAGTESRRRQQGPTCSRLAGGSPSTGHCSLGTTLLLAWLSVGWGLCSTQGTASRSPAFGLDPPSRQRRQLGRGEWTPWGGWSACSSTCGDGASFRTRKCIRFLEEESCAGEPRQYRVCKRHECPASTVPFRAMQCSLYDGKPILGSQARYRWVPFHGAPNLCDLNCLAVGHNFYYTFGRVLDGTRCSLDSPGLCISGQCLVGPTAAAGHGACGRPGLVPKGLTSPWRRGMLARAWALPASQPLISGGVGGGVPALAVQGGASVPGAAPARQGYWGQPPAPPLMLHFPPDRGLRRDPGLWGWERRLRPVRRAERVLPLRAEGVPGRAPLLRFLWVQERDEDPGRGDAHQGHRPEPQLPSTSLTWAAPLSPSAALMTGEQRYVINGDWAIDWPGAYEVAGTTVRYARNADNHETLEAAGPTAEDLHVMVLFQEPNPGIEYEFWLPRDQHGRLQGDSSHLHQPPPRGIGLDPPSTPQPVPPTTPAPPTPPSLRATPTERPRHGPTDPAQPGSCGRCQTPKGKSQRIRHYCQSDFVFRARILAKRPVGQETRYDVQVQHTYRNRFPLVHREYVWVPDACDCPALLERREYLLMARRHVNYEHTLNRILLPRGSYTRPWSPREDALLRDIAGRCAQGRPA
ncbi:ADAMTS-like protein 5 isoform X2 [Pelodiscus sinensis]|uniref:ADAMTS-like protein 5 isoform X2 n=1 Tax=Pelodiscus sinensis TaxID=13735 RepID=UPI003F6A8818